MKELIGNLEHSLTEPAPRIEPYLPAPKLRNGIGLIVFPGGGYEHLSVHEGKGYAEYFRDKGISCFVVNYRLGSQGHRHPSMLEDALAAIATIRKQAGELGLNPSKIGVIGSSAGGHLAAHSMVAYNTYKNSVSLRPDFAILCYPLIRIKGKYSHAETRANLLGNNPSEKLIHEVSCEERVKSETPPCFIWHTWKDDAVPVENSMLFASSLRKHGVPFELHIYQKGEHGLGLNTEIPWGKECLRWLRDIA